MVVVRASGAFLDWIPGLLARPAFKPEELEDRMHRVDHATMADLDVFVLYTCGAEHTAVTGANGTPHLESQAHRAAKTMARRDPMLLRRKG